MRQNLLRNPSFRLGLDNWQAINGANISITSETAFYGNEALQVVKASVINSGVETITPASVVPNSSYAGSAYVRVPVRLPPEENASIVLTVSWLAADGSIISTEASDTLNLTPAMGWSRVTGIFISPANAVFASVSITQLTAGTANEIFLVDAVLFEESTYVGGYLDNVTPAEEAHISNTALQPRFGETIGGLQLNADVIINDLVLNTIDENQVLWVCTDIDGWWYPAEPQVPSIARGVEDGDYEISGRTRPRIFTLEGVFIPPNTGLIGAARDRLITAINLARRGGWLRTNEDPTKASFVRLNGRPEIRTTNARGRTEFSIPLKAADPIKYAWNDEDADGIYTVEIAGDVGTGSVVNTGTADVTATFEITGPIGSGSTIENVTTGEVITILESLRSDSPMATVDTRQLFASVVTMTTTAPHQLVVGDEIVVSGVGTPFDAVNETFTVTSTSDVYPYRFSYNREWPSNIDTAAVSGTVALARRDRLEIDTYERSVIYNGNSVGHRSKIATMVDWIKFPPGTNIVQFTDRADNLNVTAKRTASGTNTLTTEAAHHLRAGEPVNIALSVDVPLARKALTSNVATLTTAVEHGFSVGDIVDVSSTAEISITNKAVTTNVATLTTVAGGAFTVGDAINVNMPTTAVISNKALTSNSATLTTTKAHGFSAGDSVTVALPTSATVIAKAASGGQAVLTTSAPHSFSVNDSITVTLPTGATITNKARVGNRVILTTSVAHNFSAGDTVTVSFPTTATITAASYGGLAGDNLVTVTTSAAHNFIAGDRVSVNIGVTNSPYNGTKIIETVTSNTFTYYHYTGADAASTVTLGASPSVTNLSAQEINGTRVIDIVPSTTQLAYTI